MYAEVEEQAWQTKQPLDQFTLVVNHKNKLK